MLYLYHGREVITMKTYYRFLFSTQEILEFDAEMVSFKTAERRAKEWAKDSNATYEYCGMVKHKEF